MIDKLFTLDGIKLSLNDSGSLVSLSISELFTDASDDLQVTINGELDLSSNNIVGFTVVLSSFGVSKDNPVDAEILNLNRGDFTGVSTSGGSGRILSCYFNGRLNVVVDIGDLETDGCDNNINLGGVEGDLVEHIVDEILGLGQGVVGFPVSTDEESSV